MLYAKTAVLTPLHCVCVCIFVCLCMHPHVYIRTRIRVYIYTHVCLYSSGLDVKHGAALA